MVLFTALGFAASALFSFQPGVATGLLAGVLIANFVPARSAGCSVRFDEPDGGMQDHVLLGNAVRDREPQEREPQGREPQGVGEPDRRD